MNPELIRIIDQIEREKGVKKEVLIEAIETAVASASKKHLDPEDDVIVRLDRESGEISWLSPKRVVEELANAQREIGINEAIQIDPNIQIGEILPMPLEAEEFGRIAAQTAKQIIFQKLREAERERIYQDFKDREGDMVTGIVQREEKGNVILELGITEGLLPRREQGFREDFRRGDRIKVYILDVRRSSKGQQIVLSRTNPGLLIKLFEMEIPEIPEGIVEIKGAVRESTGRSKIAVVSHQNDVDPVGACVGMRGNRVQAIVQELRGEKIDIIRWTEDPVEYVSNALSPAKITRVEVNEKGKSMIVIVPEDQLPLAIGKKGQNVRLAQKLTRWKIEVYNESEYQQKISENAEKTDLHEGEEPPEVEGFETA